MQDQGMPDPAEYGISSKYGFLSPDAPATTFQDAYYQPWDALTPQLNTLISDGNLEKAVDTFPRLSTEKLQGEVEHRRAYVVLGFIIHGYVWCRSPPHQHVPPQLAEPFLDVCAHLRMEPVLSYAGLCLWNWRVRNGGPMALVNLELLASFTGARGEAAFYLVPVLIEAEGGPLMHVLLNAVEKAQHGQFESVVEALKETTDTLVRMGAPLSKFYGILEPDFFYHELRPFLAGGNGMDEKGLPDGMILQKSDGSQMLLKLVGGSVAQGTLFPFLDAVLGIVHEDHNVFNDMRAYMPGAHRDFLEDVSRSPALREFVEARPDDVDLRTAFDVCLQQLKSWRSRHIAVVSRYIVQPARQAAQVAPVEKIETNGPTAKDKEWELQGTGGSALIPFLRQARDDTVGIKQPG